MDSRKYIFQDGKMVVNPDYQQTTTTITHQTAQPITPQALTIVSSLEDIAMAQEHAQMVLAPSTISIMDQMQAPGYMSTNSNKSNPTYLDKLTRLFAKHDIPIGMITKLQTINKCSHYIIDDSESMSRNSDVKLSEASSEFFNSKFAGKEDRLMTRWEEAEDRLHAFIDFIAYLPARTVQMTFLNRHKVVDLFQQHHDPKKMRQEAHNLIHYEFKHHKPAGGTPMKTALKNAFGNAGNGTNIYLLTDGEPDEKKSYIKNLIKNRDNPENSPLICISCTNKPANVAWMKTLDKKAPYVSVFDDYETTRQAVLETHGAGLRYTRGMWRLCQLAAANNPDDLDKFTNGSRPFTRKTLTEILGYIVTLQEYAHYFNLHPKAKKWMDIYQEFARQDIVASRIDIEGLRNHNAQLVMQMQTMQLQQQQQTMVYPTLPVGQMFATPQQPVMGYPTPPQPVAGSQATTPAPEPVIMTTSKM